MYPIPPIPRRRELSEHSLQELAAILMYAAIASDLPAVRVTSRLIRERVEPAPRRERGSGLAAKN